MKPSKEVKYKIDDYSICSDKDLMDKMEMYIGRMTMLNLKSNKEREMSELNGMVKKWFGISLNMYNITQEIIKRTE